MGSFKNWDSRFGFVYWTIFNEADLDAFWDAFIAEAIEGAGLMCGGGCGREWDVFVSRPHRQSATEEDRRAIAAWLEGYGQIADIHIGPLVDAWHTG